ncbi:MAG: polyamine aminopropyltransferase, partial [Deltaproteobacteria bacterium]
MAAGSSRHERPRPGDPAVARRCGTAALLDPRERSMTKRPENPDPVFATDPGPPSFGFVEGDWFVEQDNGSTRLSMRVARLLHEERSPYQKISVYDTPFFGLMLAIDDIIMLTERDEFVYHEMLVHVPLLSLDAPRSVLIIGGGDCGCLREALKHPSLERAVQCEIDERVTRVCAEHFPWVQQAIDDPRAELVFADGVSYVAEHPGEFDAIIVDSTDPVGAGAALFRSPFYRSAAAALRPGGILTAQGESPHWDAGLVAAIHAELRAAFAHVTGYLCMTPSYPSGCWNLAFASDRARRPGPADDDRARFIAGSCLYYSPDVHR